MYLIIGELPNEIRQNIGIGLMMPETNNIPYIYYLEHLFIIYKYRHPYLFSNIHFKKATP